MKSTTCSWSCRLNDVQAILGAGATGIEVKLKDVYQADRVRSELSKKLGPGYILRTWIEMNRNLFSALKLEKIAMFIILALIIFVASFNIISSLVMTVMEKKKDIAILKAMGARNRSIMKIFMAEGLTIGVFGALVGSVTGYLMCAIQNRYQIIKLSEEVYYYQRAAHEDQCSRRSAHSDGNDPALPPVNHLPILQGEQDRPCGDLAL